MSLVLLHPEKNIFSAKLKNGIIKKKKGSMWYKELWWENEEIQGLLKYVKEYNLSNVNRLIEVKQYSLRNDGYEITIDEQFDYKCEIR